MVTRAMLKNYLEESYLDFLDIFDRTFKGCCGLTENSEIFIKTGLALNPDLALELFGSCASQLHQSVLVSFIENLYLHLFSGRKAEKGVCKIEFDSLFKGVSAKEKCSFENFNELLLSEIQDIKTENEHLKGLLEDFNVFLLDVKEESLNLNKESYRRLKSLKASLSNLSTLASITKRNTDSKFPSIELDLSADISNEENPKVQNEFGFFHYDRADKNKTKQERINNKKENTKSIENQKNTFKQIKIFQNSLSSRTEKLEAEFRNRTKKQLKKLESLKDQLRKVKYQSYLNTKSPDFKYYKKYLNKISSEKDELLESYENLKAVKSSLETRFAKNILNLESQIKSRNTEIASLHENIHSLESKLDSSKTGNSRDPAVFINIDQKLPGSEPQQENSLSLSQNFQKPGLKLQISPNENSLKDLSFSDFLDPPKSSPKDQQIIELQDALKLVSERFETEKKTLLKDLEDSRQDMENQIFRLKQEKIFQERVCKDLKSRLQEMQKEKESLEKELIFLKIQKNRCVKDDRSLEFEVSNSLEGPELCPQRTIQDVVVEELNEISLDIRKKHLIDLNTAEVFEIIKSTLAHMIKIKGAIECEISYNEKYREASRNLSDVMFKLKSIVKNIEAESRILNEKIDSLENDLVFTDIREVRVEYQGLIRYYKKQLQIEKSKLLEKKHCIKSLKEQVGFLKKSFSDLQGSQGKIKEVDFSELREMFLLFIKDIPILNEEVECKLDSIFTRFCLSKQEINQLIQQRTKSNFLN